MSDLTALGLTVLAVVTGFAGIIYISINIFEIFNPYKKMDMPVFKSTRKKSDD